MTALRLEWQGNKPGRATSGKQERVSVATPDDQRGIDARIAALLRPETYPVPPTRIEAVETHFSWVFLTDRFVYKLKKPVKYDARDLRSLEARKANCLEELRLNRPLAGDLYIDVVPLGVDAGGRFHLEGGGTAVDWLVKMYRLPADRMLDAVIRRRAVEPIQIERVAVLLAAFYQASPPEPLSGEAYRQRLADDIRLNCRELRRPEYGLPHDTAGAVCERQISFLARFPGLFDKRVAEGHVVEGHGDLRTEHVCLVDPPVIFDRLEFDRNLRIADAVDELAFLALEGERIGDPSVGPGLFRTYQRITGDDPPSSLVAFYSVYRACLWARLAVDRTRDLEQGRWEKWLRRATTYLGLAERASRAIASSEP